MKPLKNNKNAAVSEVVSSVMLIGITIAVSLAVFSFANQQAGLSAQQYGTTVGNSIATLGEQFVVADLSYTTSGQNVTIWVYNNGQITLQLVQVLIYDSSRSLYIRHNLTHIVDMNSPSTCKRTDTPGMQVPQLSTINVPAGSLQEIRLSLPCPPPVGSQTFSTGTTYFVSILAKQGNAVIYGRQK